jgi:Mce-associated membrane protein
MASSLFTVRSRRGSGGRRHSGAEQPHGAERPLTKEHELVATDAVEAPPEAPESRGVEDASQDPTSTAKVIDDGARTGAASAAHRPSRTRLALTSLLVVMITLGALAGWLEYRLRQTQQVAAQRAEFVQAARQGAVNLTTIDWQHAEADVQRILASATGTFDDDFSKRSGPFVDVVKQGQAKSEGAVSIAGLERINGDQAQVLVAVSVKTTNVGSPQRVHAHGACAST